MNEPDAVNKKIAEEFRCSRCTECCRQPGFVYVSPEETTDMASLLGLSDFDFVNEYCDLVDRRKLVLKKTRDEVCVFLKGDACLVHDKKPRQCRDFPFKWRTPGSFSYCGGLRALFPSG